MIEKAVLAALVAIVVAGAATRVGQELQRPFCRIVLTFNPLATCGQATSR